MFDQKVHDEKFRTNLSPPTRRKALSAALVIFMSVFRQHFLRFNLFEYVVQEVDIKFFLLSLFWMKRIKKNQEFYCMEEDLIAQVISMIGTDNFLIIMDWKN